MHIKILIPLLLATLEAHASTFSGQMQEAKYKLATIQVDKIPFFFKKYEYEYHNGERIPVFKSTEPTTAYLIKGDEVIISGDDGILDSKLYATFINPNGVETRGWLPQYALKSAKVSTPPSSWNGTWHSNSSERKMTIHNDNALYEYIGGGRNLPIVAMKMKLTQLSPTKARLDIPEGEAEPCSLEIHRFNDYLAVEEIDCFIMNANPNGILRKIP